MPGKRPYRISTPRFFALLILGIGLLGSLPQHLPAQKHRTSVSKYYDSGEAKFSGVVKKGIKVGEWQFFEPDGRLISRIHYRQDTLWGKAKYYWENEELKAFGRYREGAKQGKWNTFHPNGVPASKGKYKTGKKVGTWRYWDKSGFIIRKEEWEEGEMISEKLYPNL